MLHMNYKRKIFENIQLKIATNKAPINAAVNVETAKPIINTPKYQNIIALTTRENKPRVKILSGSVSILITGLINILNKVKTAPTINETVSGLMVMPSTSLDANITAQDNINQCKIIRKMNFINLFLYV
jgi:hypothetical protein